MPARTIEPAAPLAPSAEAADESALFREATTGVRPLSGDAGGRVGMPGRRASVEELAERRRAEEAESHALLAELVSGDGAFDWVDSDERIEGVAPGVNRQLLAKLRRGDFAIQAHLDLHGFDRESARVRVEGFLSEARVRGHRCVLVIHGRGLNSPGNLPVLKEQLRHWLARGRIARSVLAFTTAQRHDGGPGATYVLLRR